MIEVYYWTTPNGHKITIFLKKRVCLTTSSRSISGKAISSSRSF